MNFNKGDLVAVTMARSDAFEWQTSPSFKAEIIYVPYGTGAPWRFKVELPNKQLVYLAINPLSSEFVGMAKYEELDDEPGPGVPVSRGTTTHTGSGT